MLINGVIFNAEMVDILNELKSQLAINGINLFAEIKESGNNIQTCCPYHKDGQERKPSAGFLKTDGTFHCFTCNTTRTLPEVISHCFGKDETGMFGWNWLLKNFLTIDINQRKEIELDISRGSGGVNITSNNIFVSEQELDSYRYYHPYMFERKLNYEVIEMFDIGYDANTRCITFPIRDVSGNCLFIARRSVDTKFFNYPESATKPIYGLYEISKLAKYPSEIIICESMLDALAAWAWGKPAVALNGLGTEKQYQQLRDMPCRKFILATDNDSAGLNARKRLRKELSNKLVTEYIFPKGVKDINDMNVEIFKNLKEVF